MRSLPPDFAPSTVAAIDARLDGIIRDHRVSIPLAVESGSRAWGFPSPDSDYDCRFVYVRTPDAYLSPWAERDVIETPLEGDLDVNGWDLGKALKLMLKGNAVILEWLSSPIAYRGDEAFRAAFLELSKRWSNSTLVARHYLHLGERQRRNEFGDGRDVALKKIFYALRPAAALRWLRVHPQAAIAPMHFPTLMAQCDPPAEVSSVVADLLIRKAETRELGRGPLPGPVGAFIDSEFEAAKREFEQGRVTLPAEAKMEAADFFRRTVRGLDLALS